MIATLMHFAHLIQMDETTTVNAEWVLREMEKNVKVCINWLFLTAFNDFIYLADFCDANLHHCNASADCIPAPGGYTCKCKRGFIGDGFNCDGKQIKKGFSYTENTLLVHLL